MKKIPFVITLLILGLSLQAQNVPTLGYPSVTASAPNAKSRTADVYFAGNGSGVGKIWKNDSLIQSISDTLFVNIAAMQVTSDGTVYTAGHVNDAGYGITQGRVWLNGNAIFNAGDSTFITAFALNDTTWTAAGIGENEWETVSGLVWQNGELLYAYTDSVVFNRIQALSVDTATGDIYTGGNSGELEEPYAAVWKNDTLLWNDYPFSYVQALAHDGTDIYAAGALSYEEQYWAALWQNDEIVFSVASDDAEFSAIAIYGGSIYLGGYNGDTLYIWQDDDVLYSHPFTATSKITALVVNEAGVYYAGRLDGVATVWHDGEILYQPDGCEAVTSLVVIPSEPIPVYTITVESAHPEWGTVTGGGTFNEGDTATIEALPNLGCEFLMWNDSVTDNPRTIVVTHDSTFIASFERIPYTIELLSDHPEWGSVAGGGTYYYGDTVLIEAMPAPHYSFIGWSDGDTDNPRTVIVTENLSLTAHFDISHYQITTLVFPEEAGQVEGGGYYPYGDTIILKAHNNTGYYFERWEDGDAENPRVVVVEDDATYTALFNPYQYEITAESDPVEGGTVTGAGTYDYGTTATLTATPNEYYMFISWSDGVITNPRNILVTQNVHLRAIFYQTGTPTYTVTVVPNDPNLGEVNGSGTYPEGTTIEISATPFENVVFTGWDDGNTDNPRSVTVTEDMVFTAVFEYVPPVQTFTILVRPENVLLGSTYGSGTYSLNETATIGAVPRQGFHFTGWQDGNADNPRTIIVTGDAEYIASFSPEPITTYTVTVQYDEEQGYVIGAGTYNAGSIATLAAIPNDDYFFVKWGDGVTDNRREVLVDHDIILAAFFNHVGVDENNSNPVCLYPNPVSDKIYLDGLEDEAEVSIYDVLGNCVLRQTLQGEEELSVDGLTAGLYLLRIKGYPTMRFVKR